MASVRRGYQIVASPDVFATTAAAFLGRKLAALVDHGPGSIALSGGTTPGPVYEALSRDPHVDWRKIDVFFADERIVPLDDPRSNYRLARETLLDRVEIPPEQVHPMPAEAADLDAAAREYGERLPDRIDLLILGLGADGHTASLFPGAPELNAQDPVVRTTAPVEPFERLSVSPLVIAAARLVVVLVRGPEKTEALGRALNDDGDVTECPARLARHGIWILASDAVGALQAGQPADRLPRGPGARR